MLTRSLKLALLMSCCMAAPGFADEPKINWRDWSAADFDAARKEHKLVLLDVRAIWCHWCHVMDDTTYSDKDIITFINDHYIAVSVDQDSQPDLSHRYEDYGWPATIIFAADGTEIVKRRGYIDPDEMKTVLKASVDDPTPTADQAQNPTPSGRAGLSENQREAILSSVVALYDYDNAGWGSHDKFLESPLMELAIGKAVKGNRVFGYDARQTLDASMMLIDPVWGGVYQYSDHVDWKSPHFEKILSIQSAYILSYAYGYDVFGEQKYKDAANNVIKYIDAFMTSPEGAFYTSQDADLSEKVTGHDYYPLGDAGRRKLGLPTIDKHSYSSENGTLISSLVVLYEMTGDKAALDRALRAMNWLVKHRALPDGGFTHDATDKDGPFFADTLYTAKAMLDLYGATADRAWLTRAEESAKFITAHFADEKGSGFFTKASHPDEVLKPYKDADDNIAAARFFNLLSYYSSDNTFKKIALSALQSASPPEEIKKHTFNPGLLLADDELRQPPLHLTVVGSKDDAGAAELFKTALAVAPLYKRTEWFDKREGKLPGSDIEFPDLPKPAVFICTNTTCSLPLYDAKSLQAKLESLRLSE